jgi:leukotriene-A4 hydrolase
VIPEIEMVKKMAAAKKRDFQTLSNYDEIRTTQLSLNLDIDFEKKRLYGNVVLKMKVQVEECDTIILDTRYV